MPNIKVVPTSVACEACGKEFLTGGRGRPRAKQRFCSLDCQQKSRYRRGTQASELAATDAAYLAGLFDGEGSVVIYLRRDAVAMFVTITNTDKPALEWVSAAVGVGMVQRQSRATSRHSESYHWRCNADAAESLLRQLLPFLRIKKPQAELAIRFQERLRDPALKSDREWQYAYRSAMQTMNARGPRP